MIIEQAVKLLASTVLAVFSGFIFMAVIMYKIAEAFFLIVFSKGKPQTNFIDTPPQN